MQEQPPYAPIYMIMHHAYFWDELIDKRGRPCGRVVNISHLISDLVGQSSLCVIVACTRLQVCVCVSMHEQQRVSSCVRAGVCGTCVGVCACVGEQHSYPSKSPMGRPPPREKNEPCPTPLISLLFSLATISSLFTLRCCE